MLMESKLLFLGWYFGFGYICKMYLGVLYLLLYQEAILIPIVFHSII